MNSKTSQSVAGSKPPFPRTPTSPCATGSKMRTRWSKKRENYIDSLPDEIIHAIMENRLSVDYDMFSHRDPTHLLAHRAEVTTLSLVCRRWRQIIVPISYETVLIYSKSEAESLTIKLRQRHQRIGHRIKKLRIEGGQGRAIYTILSKVPNLTSLCISLDDVTSKQKAGSLCRGLKQVNPRHFVFRDHMFRRNQGNKYVIDVLVECMTSIWSNLVLYDHPYDIYDWPDEYYWEEVYERAQALSTALAHVPNLQTVYVPRACYITDEDDVVLNALKNPSLKRIYSRIFWEETLERDFEEAIKAHPRIREIIHLPLPGPWTYPIYAPIGNKTQSQIRKTFTFFTRGADIDTLGCTCLRIFWPEQW